MSDFPVLWRWKHISDGKFELVFNYEYMPDGSSIATAQVTAAYNTAASVFVKRVLAYHDRAYKRQLKTVYNQLHGSIGEKLNEGFEPWDINKLQNGFVLLQSVATLDLQEDSKKPIVNYHVVHDQDSWLAEENLFVLSKIEEDTEFKKEHQLINLKFCRSHQVPQRIQDVSTKERKKIAEELDAAAVRASQKVLNDTILENTQDKLLNPTAYRLVNGYVAESNKEILYRPSQYAAMMYDEMLGGEISGDLPHGTTLNIKGYLQAARDETSFKALRLDMIPDVLSNSVFTENDDLPDGFDFDAVAQSFELRLHAGDCVMHKKHLKHFFKLVSLCIYSTSPYTKLNEDEIRPLYDFDGSGLDDRTKEIAQKGIRQAQAETRAFAGERTREWPFYYNVPGSTPRWQLGTQKGRPRLPPEDHAKPTETNEYFGTASAMVWTPVLEGTAVNEMALDFVRDTTPPSLLYNEDKTQYDAFVVLLDSVYDTQKCIILRSAVESADFELELPYEPHFIDMTDSDDQIVLGSTVTPFVLALKTAEILLRKSFQKSQTTGGVLRTEVEENTLTAETLKDTFVKHFKGIHFSNRKALGSGVYAVLFENSPIFSGNSSDTESESTVSAKGASPSVSPSAEFEEETSPSVSPSAASVSETSSSASRDFDNAPSGSEGGGAADTNPLQFSPTDLTIHGRAVVDRKHDTFIAMLYDLIFEADEVHRRLRGLIRPYIVMVKGPGPNALVTPMSFGTWAYASPEMLAIEQEAVALLSHISRDTRKRKRNPDPNELQQKFARGEIRDFMSLEDFVMSYARYSGNTSDAVRKRGQFAASAFRLIRALLAYNDIFLDSGKTQRDRVAMARFDSERFAAAHELLFTF